MAIFNSNSGGSGNSSKSSSFVNAPVGAVMNYCGNTAPDGWALCEGQTYPIGTYPILEDLFIQQYEMVNKFGGDGISTFAIPDLRDKFVLGAGTSYTVGSEGGSETVTLTVEQMPRHNHEERFFSEESNNYYPTGVTTNLGKVMGVSFGGAAVKIAAAISTQTTGSSQPHNNMPPYYALCYIMKLTADPTDGVTQAELTTALADKQDTLVNGTGTTVLNNGVNINTPVQQIVTQAEFDALPEDDQNKGLWVISDGESGGGSSGGEIYSTEETRIGTWIDGKPLYRMVATFQGPINAASGYGTFYTLPDSMNYDYIQYYGWIRKGTTTTPINYNNYYSGAGASFAYSILIGNNFGMRVGPGDDITSGNVTVIFEYTKTTDTATQEVTT